MKYILVGWIVIFVFCLGFPFASLVASHRACEVHDTPSARAYVALLTASYTPRFFYFEAIDLVRKFILSSALVKFYPRTRLQLFGGALGAAAATLAFVGCRPYRERWFNFLQGLACLQILFTFCAAMVFIYEDDADALSAENDDVFGWVLVLINSICLASIPFYLLTVVRAARRLADDEMVARCEAAITQTQQLRFPCHFLFSVLKARGKLETFEALRTVNAQTKAENAEDGAAASTSSESAFVVCDSYKNDLAPFVAKHPTIFISHQWLGHRAPDPDGIHFKAIIQACEALAAEADLKTDDLFLWVDYSCVPQVNKFTQALAIHSLMVYASACRYFIACAPDAKHAQTGATCNLESYQRRGWCRLERLRLSGGTEGMYYYSGSVSESGWSMQGGKSALQTYEMDEKAVHQAVLVMEADFTLDSDKEVLVDEMLASSPLYAQIRRTQAYIIYYSPTSTESSRRISLESCRCASSSSRRSTRSRS